MRKALYFLGILDDRDTDWMIRHGTKMTVAPGAHLIEQLLHRRRAIRIEAAVQAHVEQGEFHLAHGLHAGLEVLGREHAFEQGARQRRAGQGG